MEKLFKGICVFRDSYFRKERELFRKLSKSQRPDVLFVTCSDSRVDPNLITQSRPGDLFIVRNVGNIIPPYDSIKDKNSSAAAVEFAVMSLKVSDIIICGHSNCGAMETLSLGGEALDDMPHLREWLKLASPVLERDFPELAEDESGGRAVEKKNILLQLENVRTYPFLERPLLEGKVRLHGWYYEIQTGEVSAFNPASGRFERILCEVREEKIIRRKGGSHAAKTK